MPSSVHLRMRPSWPSQTAGTRRGLCSDVGGPMGFVEPGAVIPFSKRAPLPLASCEGRPRASTGEKGGRDRIAVGTTAVKVRQRHRSPPGGGGQLTVEPAGNRPRLRKVRTPGTVGAGASPPGESPSDGAETTQPGGTGMALRRRFPRDMMKRPTPLEQALSDGRRRSPDRRGGRAVECCRNRMRLIPATWPHRRAIGGGFPAHRDSPETSLRHEIPPSARGGVHCWEGPPLAFSSAP